MCLLIGVVAFAQTRDSIEQQMKSVAQQREAVKQMPRPLVASRAPECDPMPEDQIAPIIDSSAKTRQVPAKLLRAVMEQESGFRPCAVSDKRA